MNCLVLVCINNQDRNYYAKTEPASFDAGSVFAVVFYIKGPAGKEEVGIQKMQDFTVRCSSLFRSSVPSFALDPGVVLHI